jgi:MORN repeat
MWVDGKMHGKGFFLYPNKNRWVGAVPYYSRIEEESTGEERRGEEEHLLLCCVCFNTGQQSIVRSVVEKNKVQ